MKAVMPHAILEHCASRPKNRTVRLNDQIVSQDTAAHTPSERHASGHSQADSTSYSKFDVVLAADSRVFFQVSTYHLECGLRLSFALSIVMPL